MAPPNIIGLTGRKGSGKSTVALALSSYSRLSFATPIKQMLLALGVTQEELADKETVIPRFGQSPRKMMQTLGDWGRGLDPDFWVKLARPEAESLLALNIGVISDDLRYNSEAEMIRSLGGPIWEIRRHTSIIDLHSSEQGISPKLVDITIANEGTLESLHRYVGNLIGFEQGVVTS